MTQLVGEGFPGLLAPVEIAEPGEARERAIIEDDPRVQVDPAVAPLERHALAESVDITVHWMRHSLGADIDGDDAVVKLRGHLTGETVDHYTEIIKAHWGAAQGRSMLHPYISPSASVRDRQTIGQPRRDLALACPGRAPSPFRPAWTGRRW